jgi:hypothetical protein
MFFFPSMYVWYDPARERGILLIRKAQRKTGSIKKIPNAQLNLPYGKHSPWFKAQWTQETSQPNVEQIRRNNHPPPKKEEEEKKELSYQFKGLPPRRLSSGSLLLAQKQLKSS